jgi:hypothetical protein
MTFNLTLFQLCIWLFPFESPCYPSPQWCPHLPLNLGWYWYPLSQGKLTFICCDLGHMCRLGCGSVSRRRQISLLQAAWVVTSHTLTRNTQSMSLHYLQYLLSNFGNSVCWSSYSVIDDLQVQFWKWHSWILADPACKCQQNCIAWWIFSQYMYHTPSLSVLCFSIYGA